VRSGALHVPEGKVTTQLCDAETGSSNLHDARAFAEAIHAEFPDKMLAYNLSPSLRGTDFTLRRL
jgi:isocitrate lyase